jgi:hypothetical protein
MPPLKKTVGILTEEIISIVSRVPPGAAAGLPRLHVFSKTTVFSADPKNLFNF